MNQNESAPEATKPKRHFLLHPAVLAIDAILMIALIVGITMANIQPKDHFTGTATVEHVNGGGKKCWVDLRTEDGVFLDNFRMASSVCGRVSEGDVIEVVKGKYQPEIAP